jgi:hypothetical protein
VRNNQVFAAVDVFFGFDDMLVFDSPTRQGTQQPSASSPGQHTFSSAQNGSGQWTESRNPDERSPDQQPEQTIHLCASDRAFFGDIASSDEPMNLFLALKILGHNRNLSDWKLARIQLMYGISAFAMLS